MEEDEHAARPSGWILKMRLYEILEEIRSDLKRLGNQIRLRNSARRSKSDDMALKQPPLPTQEQDQPQQKAPHQIVQEFGSDPMQPSPKLLRQIALAIAGHGENASKAEAWAEAFLAAYPNE